MNIHNDNDNDNRKRKRKEDDDGADGRQHEESSTSPSRKDAKGESKLGATTRDDVGKEVAFDAEDSFVRQSILQGEQLSEIQQIVDNEEGLNCLTDDDWALIKRIRPSWYEELQQKLWKDHSLPTSLSLLSWATLPTNMKTMFAAGLVVISSNAWTQLPSTRRDMNYTALTIELTFPEATLLRMIQLHQHDYYLKQIQTGDNEEAWDYMVSLMVRANEMMPLKGDEP